ncbi:MAG: YdcF family protein [Melioribacteraceae bacterium]
MKRNMRNNRPLIIITFVAIIYLLGLLILKYDLNNLALAEFRVDYIGNILNILIALLIVVACIVLSTGKKNIDRRRANLILVFQIVSLLSLVFVFFVQKLNLINNSNYLFNFPAKKVYVGLSFIFSDLLQIFSMIYLYGIIIGDENYFELRALIRTIVAVVILLVFSLLYVWNVKVYDESKLVKTKYDYGLIPGAAVYSKGKPSPIFEARIRKALELYREGIIKNILLTGGKAPGEISESESAFNYLTNLGIPKKDIAVENRSSTTSEQIKYLRDEILTLKNNNTVLIISDGFHLSRIIQIAKFFKIKTIGVSSDYTMSFSKTLFYRARESVALLLFWFFAI